MIRSNKVSSTGSCGNDYSLVNAVAENGCVFNARLAIENVRVLDDKTGGHLPATFVWCRHTGRRYHDIVSVAKMSLFCGYLLIRIMMVLAKGRPEAALLATSAMRLPLSLDDVTELL